MWNISNVGKITVYWQRVNECKYEIHQSSKIELIIKDSSRHVTTYFRFEGTVARDHNEHIYDEEIVEKAVKGLPEIDALHEKIIRALQAVKKKEFPKKAEPTEPTL